MQSCGRFPPLGLLWDQALDSLPAIKAEAAPSILLRGEQGDTPQRHCERSEAIHLTTQRKNALLRRNDVETIATRSRHARPPRCRRIQARAEPRREAITTPASTSA